MPVGAPPTTSAGATAAIRRSRSTTSESNSGIRGHLVPEMSPKQRKCGTFPARTLPPAPRRDYARRGEEAGLAGASKTRLVRRGRARIGLVQSGQVVRRHVEILQRE